MFCILYGKLIRVYYTKEQSKIFRKLLDKYIILMYNVIKDKDNKQKEVFKMMAIAIYQEPEDYGEHE